MIVLGVTLMVGARCEIIQHAVGWLIRKWFNYQRCVIQGSRGCETL